MNFLTFLVDLHQTCHFQTREGKRVGRASNSEIRRWFQNGAVVVNGEKVACDEPVDFQINSLVLFPKKPVTLW